MPLKKSSKIGSHSSGRDAKKSSSPALPGELGPRVARAFHGKRAKWRTAGGIARAADLKENVVLDYIEESDCFVIAPVSPAGKRLYAVKPLPA